MVKSKGNDLIRDWQKKAKLGGTCPRCNTYSRYMTVDHIVPVNVLDALDESGEAKLNDEENFEIICKICNTLKSGRLDKRHPKTKQIILKYL